MTLKMIAFNYTVPLTFAMFMNILLDNWNIKMSFAIEDLPDSKTLMMTIAFCMICEDFSFYFLHKLLH